MQDGQGHRAMKFMLGGDNHGIEEAPVGGCIKGIGQGDSGAELDCVDHQAKQLHTHTDHVRIVPAHTNTNITARSK